MSGRNFPADTQRQKFFEEFYNKERDTRIAWFLKVKANSGDSAPGESKQYQVFKKKIESHHLKAPVGKLPPIRAKQFHKKTFNSFPEDDTCEQPADTKMVVEMRPVSTNTRSKLYTGFSKEGKGRYQYLHERYQVNPEEKFEYPLLSSWEYGWRLGDVIKKDDIRKPTHGRTRIVADTFYTRTGVPTLK